jgi:UDP-N-acetylmuramate dehydrogenase
MTTEEGSLMTDYGIDHMVRSGLVRGEVKYGEPLSAYTSLNIGGPAEVMIFPEDPLSVRHILHAVNQKNIPLFILGAGTNLLVSDEGIKGITMSLKAFSKIELTRGGDDENAVLYVGAGVPLPRVVHFAKKNGYSGIEALAGIPGSFGGAVRMNAGSFGTEIKDVIDSVALMNRRGELRILKKSMLSFGYRNSNLPDDAVLLSANIVLRREDPDEVAKRTDACMQKKRDSQPVGAHSAGCVFKNPEGESAGRLIEKAGCKGMNLKGVEVSTLHANYFINSGNARSGDFIELMNIVIAKVKDMSGITLEPEIRIIGDAKK